MVLQEYCKLRVTSRSIARIARAAIPFVLFCTTAMAQLQIGNSNPQTPQSDPVTLQIKKSVVFLETSCLHDFQPDLAQLTPDTLAKITLINWGRRRRDL